MTEELCITTAAQLYHSEEDLILLKKLARDITHWSALYEMAELHGILHIPY